MEKFFVDSNVFLRYYSRDDAEQSDLAKKLLLKARDKKISLFCGPPVFFEVAWVLKSAYSLPNADILNTLETMLLIPNMDVIDGDMVRDAIALARETGQGFADSYIAATAQRLEIGVATFNQKHFTKLGAPVYRFDGKK